MHVGLSWAEVTNDLKSFGICAGRKLISSLSPAVIQHELTVRSGASPAKHSQWVCFDKSHESQAGDTMEKSEGLMI